MGMAYRYTAVPFHVVITTVMPGSPAAKAGASSGDVIDLTRASAPDRWRITYGWVANQTYRYVLLRDGAERRVTLRAKHQDLSFLWWNWSSWFVGALGALTFATIIAWRRPWLAEARVLCLLLIAWVVGPTLAANNFITPWPRLDFAAEFAYIVLINLVVVLIVAYTLLFGRPVSAIRKASTALSFLIIILIALNEVAASVGIWRGAFDWAHDLTGVNGVVRLWLLPACWVAVILAVVLTLVATRGRERSMFVWTMTLPFLSYLAQAVWDVLMMHATALAPWHAYGAAVQVTNYVANASEFLTPFAIGYALLSRSRFSPMTAAAGTTA
jgi:hypothetical protein